MGSPPADPAGILLVDKPAGPTSHAIVARARRALGERRVGHAGTLDPFATGLLLLCAGSATRLVEYFHLLPKVYEAELRLGVETETHDPEGRPTRTSEEWRALGPEDLIESLAAHTGKLAQRPPSFSAKRVEGRRAYEAARRGERLDLDPVTVRVHRLELLAFRPPSVRVAAVVSAGTYVRGLARDLGRSLGCFAHLVALRRTAIGPFEAGDALAAARLDEVGVGELLAGGVGSWWLSPSEALGWLPRRELDAKEATRVRSGARIPTGRVEPPPGAPGPGRSAPGAAAPPGGGLRDEPLPVALLRRGRLLGVAARADGSLQPRKVFPDA